MDRLFNSGEIKIARAVLLWANFGVDGKPKTVSSNVCQDALANMSGKNRSQVRLFVQTFRRSGFVVQGRSGLHIHSLTPQFFVQELPRANRAREERGER